MLVKVREQGGVSQVLQAGGIVSSTIEGSRQVRGNVAVAMEPLVIRGELAQVGGGPWARDGAFAEARQAGDIVAEIFDGGVAQVAGGAHDIGLRQEGGLLEIAVGDCAAGVGMGDEAVADCGWKW